MVAGSPLPQGDISVDRLADALRSLDIDAIRVTTVAHNEAYRYTSGFLASTHLLLGLLAVAPAGIAVKQPADVGCPPELRRQLDLYLGPLRPLAKPVHLPYTPHARAIVINAATRATDADASAATTPEHLWSALKNASGSLAVRCLAGLGR